MTARDRMTAFLKSKFDIKLVLVPFVVLFASVVQVDFQNAQVVTVVQGAFFAVVVFVFTLHAVIYRSISLSKDLTPIWLTPKAPFRLPMPFGWGSSPARLTLEDFEATTIFAQEAKLLRANVYSCCTTCTVAYLMSVKFGLVMMLVVAIGLPISISNHPVLKKHVLSVQTKIDGSRLYDEVLEQPDAAMIAALNAAAGFSAEGEEVAEVAAAVLEPADEDDIWDSKDNSQGKEKPKKKSKAKGKGGKSK